tara:strand:- start:875 stop:1012 length:138 start_codon:yes stop_codon:yes gene_type:complete
MEIARNREDIFEHATVMLSAVATLVAIGLTVFERHLCVAAFSKCS